MVIFGSRKSVIGAGVIQEACANCKTSASVELIVVQRYAHIFWIPIFPMGKTGLSECSHCKQVLRKKEFTESLSYHYERMKLQSKTPLWTFSGVGLLVGLFCLGGVVSHAREKENTQWILEPQQGDVYDIKLDYKQYTLFQVSHVVGDTVFVWANQYETNKRRGLSDLKKRGDDAYIQEPVPIVKEELKEMLASGKIMDITRDGF
jgi:hypothetical protein